MIDVERTEQKQAVISRLKAIFQLYGYDEITTSAFGQYDLYAQMTGTVNHNEMVKTIDNTGQVLVLRPDITIPLTEKVARQTKQLPTDVRYFYVLDVFRQLATDTAERERTQAGVEYLGNVRPQADAEVIALAIDILKQVGMEQVTIEIGHAGFFKQLTEELALDQQSLHELITYIQAKNVPALEKFTEKFELNEDHRMIIQSLPFLYGRREEVMEKVSELPLSDGLKESLNRLSMIFNVLAAYDFSADLVMDLSLINHMDYYSGVIFQGFIEKAGKPIVMGGRYDTLSEQFGASIPAVGFAFDVDTLFEHIHPKELASKSPIDCLIRYADADEKKALHLANTLRNASYRVLTYPNITSNTSIQKTTYTIDIKKDAFIVQNEDEMKTEEAIIQFLKNKER